MNTIKAIKILLQQSVTVSQENHARFFKMGPGQYAEHDQFMGVKVPILRGIARQFNHLSYPEILIFLQSPINEERLLALFIMVYQYQKGTEQKKHDVYQLYMTNLRYVNNWNLVDSSAHLIVGDYLYCKQNNNILLTLATSQVMWERRIAIVATWYFIRHNNFEWTFKIATILIHDTHDLIHKAVGWMLREVGKRDQAQLILFLDQHALHMPRVMLRYAIEKFSEQQRKIYLKQSFI
jgi:3-methyladenine DNA glycosylase AlkD